MRRLTILATVAIVLGVWGGSAPTSALAQSLRYVDESGNIHFVERLSDIPARYRQQVVQVQPTAVSEEDYRKQLSEWKRQQKSEEKEAKRQVRERQKLEKQKKKEIEKEDRKRQKELQKKNKIIATPRPEKAAAKPTPKPSVTPDTADAIGRVRAQ